MTGPGPWLSLVAACPRWCRMPVAGPRPTRFFFFTAPRAGFSVHRVSSGFPSIDFFFDLDQVTDLVDHPPDLGSVLLDDRLVETAGGREP